MKQFYLDKVRAIKLNVTLLNVLVKITLAQLLIKCFWEKNSMLRSWMLIALITFLVALGGFALRPKDVKWFSQLQRPKWLVFEPAIPIIWTVIFICGAWSANLVWQQDPGSLQTSLILFLYLLLEIIIVAYFPVTLWSENLNKGTIIGGTGIVLGVILISIVSSVSSSAALLLLPYLLWSPIGTYTTWEMNNLNPKSAKQPI